MDSSPPAPIATPPSRRSKPSTLCLVDDESDPNSPPFSPPLLKKRQLQFPPDPHPPAHLPLRELILLSPTRRPRSRGLDTENIDPNGPVRGRSKSKGKSKNRSVAPNVGLMDCTSPRGDRRPRRKSEKVTSDEREFGFFEDGVVRVRRQKRDSRSATASLGLIPVASPAHIDQMPRCIERGEGDQDGRCLQGVCEFVSEMVMWKDVAKSSLWFGFGSLCFLSSCFSTNLSFDYVSAISHLGLLVLASAFFYDAFSQRAGEQKRLRFRLKEEDLRCTIRMVLPMANAAIAVGQEIFSGEPSMTLKVAAILLLTTKYSHLITLWRILAVGFFTSFTIPKLLSCYSHSIQKHVKGIDSYLSEAWNSCRHKRIVTLSCGTMVWNLFGLRERIIAAFLAVVVLRYHRNMNVMEEELTRVNEVDNNGVVKEDEMVIVEEEESKKQS